jgi:hypothetical protein
MHSYNEPYPSHSTNIAFSSLCLLCVSISANNDDARLLFTDALGVYYRDARDSELVSGEAKSGHSCSVSRLSYAAHSGIFSTSAQNILRALMRLMRPACCSPTCHYFI